MLNSMVVVREKRDDYYNLTLEVSEKEYFEIYDDIDREAAEGILKQYLIYHGDDGRYSDIEIKHDKGAHIIAISAKLSYTDNDHTKQFNIPNHLED